MTICSWAGRGPAPTANTSPHQLAVQISVSVPASVVVVVWCADQLGLQSRDVCV